MDIAPPNSASAVLNPNIIQKVVQTFPRSGDWKDIPSNSFLDQQRSGKRCWTSIDHLSQSGGVYAFLVPTRFFDGPKSINLHGPRGTRIKFDFTLKPLQEGENGVIYVGRTSNLQNRFRAHHSVGDRLASGPVKYGLIDCGVCKNQQYAIDFLHAHARIVYHALAGPENAANRDIIELTLCSLWMPPFNVKAER